MTERDGAAEARPASEDADVTWLRRETHDGRYSTAEKSRLNAIADRLAAAPRAEPGPYNSTIGRLDKIIHWAREWIDEDSAHGFPRLILAEAQQLRSEWPRISAGALPDESERALAGCYRAAYVGICFGCPPEISPHDLLRPLVEAAKDAAPYAPRAEPLASDRARTVFRCSEWVRVDPKWGYYCARPERHTGEHSSWFAEEDFDALRAGVPFPTNAAAPDPETP